MLAALALAPASASAHNLGCLPTPNGVVEVGSQKNSPLVSPNAPSIWDDERQGWQLDLIEGDGDQFGARFAAEQGKSKVQPPTRGVCP